MRVLYVIYIILLVPVAIVMLPITLLLGLLVGGEAAIAIYKLPYWPSLWFHYHGRPNVVAIRVMGAE